jgi:hypothetical protein
MYNHNNKSYSPFRLKPDYCNTNNLWFPDDDDDLLPEELTQYIKPINLSVITLYVTS